MDTAYEITKQRDKWSHATVKTGKWLVLLIGDIIQSWN